MLTAEADAPRLLCVEDDLTMGLVLQGFVAACGWTMTLTNDGLSAHRLAMSEPFDVLIVDHFLPRQSGSDMISTLRAQQGPNAATPALVISSEDLSGIRGPVMAAQAEGFLRKPFGLPAFREAVSALLSRTYAPRPASPVEFNAA